MIYYKDYDYNLKPKLVKRNGKYYDDNIYTFDIETTSVIYNPFTDKTFLFDKSKPPEFYDTMHKYGYMYIWQFSINDDVLYGRYWEEFIELLTVLKKVYFGLKIIFVHNLGFEFQSMKNYFDDFKIFARTNHKPITARSEYYNIEFRCTLMLTNMKLESIPKNYNLPIKKQVGLLDYDKIRTNETELTDDELKYCEYDCLVLYELIKKMREQYINVVNIPLTQTGELRRVCQKLYKDDFKYKKWLNKQLIGDIRILQFCLKAFMGGYTHANACYANRTIYDVQSYDIASSYPYAETAEIYPVSKPFPISPDFTIDDMINDTKKLYITEITFYNIESVMQSNILSESKCYDKYHVLSDNGRVRKADRLTVVLTNIDLINIRKFYKWDEEKTTINKTYGFFADYLDKKFINLIWDLYVDKTALKGITEEYENYMRQKRYINACYGMTVTNLITDDVVYNSDKHIWEEPTKLTPETAQEKLNKINKNRKTFLNPLWGVFVTAYARKNLFDCMYKIEKRSMTNGYNCGVIYCDTDSIKCFGDVSDIFEEYNKTTEIKLKRVADKLGLDFEKTRPKTIKGKQKPLGVFEYEETYNGGFKTLGAKKYLTKHDTRITFNIKGRKKKFSINAYTLHLTLAGVSKEHGARALKNLDDFKKGFIFGYDETGKKLLYYSDGQPELTVIDCNGKLGKLRGESGICLTPCRYKLGIKKDYFDYINEIGNDETTLHGLMQIEM